MPKRKMASPAYCNAIINTREARSLMDLVYQSSDLEDEDNLVQLLLPHINFGKMRMRRAPANGQYRKQVNEKVTWAEILTACGYEIEKRSLPTHSSAAAWRPRRSGDFYYVLCTLHLETKASMCLSPWEFFCFGCGARGDKVDFAAGVMHLRTAQSVRQFFTETFSQMCKE